MQEPKQLTRKDKLTFFRRLMKAVLENKEERYPKQIKVVAENFLYDHPEYKINYSTDKIMQFLEKIQAIYEL